MSVARKLVFLLLGLSLASCIHPTVSPEPENTSLANLARNADSPQQAASLRVVEDGRKELRRLRFESAAHLFSRAIEIDAENAFAYFYLGLTRYRTNRYRQAGELFARSARLFSRYSDWQAESLAYRGECLEQLKQPKKAKQEFQAALDADRGNQRARSGLERLTP